MRALSDQKKFVHPIQTQPDPIAPEPIRVDPSPIQLERDAVRRRLGSDPAWLETKSEKNAKTRDFAFRAPSACLPRAFRVPSGTAPFGCAQFWPGSAATRLGSVPFRLGSDSFWRGSALLGTGSARLRFVNELFFCLSDFFLIKCHTAI